MGYKSEYRRELKRRRRAEAWKRNALRVIRCVAVLVIIVGAVILIRI